ncbi:MAG: Gfo/Idh/MocA family oxidoreductase [Candidatus Lokiarchaeota archaeon]|nr:Gfo/Idh/MocA family oxidoreductase [Candidatus Harpocratesius repetitus]
MNLNHSAKSRKKRALIVGIGGHAHVWRKAIETHPRWEIGAVVDTNTDKLEHAPKIWGIPKGECFTSMEEAIQFGKGPYDLAILVTPTYTHHVLSMEALDLGLNVLSEKNMASTISQAREMVKTAAKYPELCTAVGTQTRFFPHNWSVKKTYLERKDSLKSITSLNLTYLYNWGKTRQGWRRWLRDLFLEDMAPHHLDLIRYLTEMDVVQVQGGVNFKPSFSYFKGSSTTFAILALARPEDYYNPDNWIYATYRGDWQKKGELYHRLDLNCEEGEINLFEKNKEKQLSLTEFEDPEGFKYHTTEIPITSDVEYNAQNYSSELFLLEEFYQGIESCGKLQPQTNFKDAIKSFAITRGIVDSFEQNRAIFIPDYWKNLNLDEGR